ncbi:MAG: GspE/PulE family protein [Oscillospiraceae bacterium]|nr:GspE/PulE family protein [Oscillospiraceae bacterium]
MAYKRLGDMLVGVGVISEQQLSTALSEQKKTGRRLGEVLVSMDIISQRQLLDTLQRQLGVDFIDLSAFAPEASLARVLPRGIAQKYHIVPVRGDNSTLFIAMDDPLNFVAVDAARAASKRRIIPMLATAEGVDRALANLYGSEGAERAIAELKSEESETGAGSATANIIGADTENAAPTIRLVNSILEYAVNQSASDIHLEPREAEMVVRMRIDGVLRKAFVVPKGTQNAVIARIKVMGNMNIAEHKIPLDGRSNVRIGDKDIDLRISTLPTVYGEKTVIRLLYKASDFLSPKGIGLTGNNLKKFEALLKNSNGVILIVGPTGSGKSSSMYTMIHRLNTEEVNLVTLEDPVEYNLDGVNQVQINDKVDMTFANGLRSILRQDPDIIAVGEIRDGETAQIAMRAAITGHLVLSTLHTNDAPGTLDRLLDMGVEPYLVSSALKGVISQRLVRRICPACREEYSPSAEEQAMLHLPYSEGRRFYRGKGCPACFNTGYHGRTAVFEILVISGAIKRAIADRVPHSELLRIINESGFETLIKDCVRLVEGGVTTVSEAYRTVNSTDA